jgi:hypothetical protein
MRYLHTGAKFQRGGHPCFAPLALMTLDLRILYVGAYRRRLGAVLQETTFHIVRGACCAQTG